MRHRLKRKKLGSKSAYQKILVINLIKSFFIHGKIKTTKTRAKLIKPYIEKIITIGKNNNLDARRTIIKKINSNAIATKIIHDISPRYKARKGGYTKIILLGQRIGDGAEEVFLLYT